MQAKKGLLIVSNAGSLTTTETNYTILMMTADSPFCFLQLLLAVTIVPDPAFTSEGVGKGIAIKPAVGRIAAPLDGKAAVIFKKKYAFVLVSQHRFRLMSASIR
ncbi:PTS glucose transporter subunit IIA [Paenibacillus sp. Z6-24]